jgi:hydroxypyruvate isomerase
MAGTAAAVTTPHSEAQEAPKVAPVKGRIRQAICRGCYGFLELEPLCTKVKAMGIVAIDLLGEGDWDTVAKHGLVSSMGYGIGSLPDAWNKLSNHDKLVQQAEYILPRAKEKGVPNVITFSGNRNGLSEKDGLANCEKGLKRIIKLAEETGVTVCMELLNSKRDHADYQCDHTPWGVELVKRLGSPRFRLLYDVYHMQIMEGDVCATIAENIEYIAHFHTGGVPGRRDIDETQEINYRRVCQTLVDVKFKGFVAHEFGPKRGLESLAKAIQICDV